MATDPFAELRPRQAEVPVGDAVLTLRTATLDQEQELLASVSGLDLGSLFGPVAELLSGETSTVGIVRALGSNGKAVWGAAQTVLGRQLAPALRNACTALLHTPQNAMILQSALKDQGGFDADGVFNCPALKAWLRQNLTFVQATRVLREAWTLNGYGEALGNLIPLAAPEAPVAEATQD